MLSIPHLIVIFVVALIIFGPEKLPELARNLGKVMAEFRRATGDLRSSFEGHMRDLEREAQERRLSAVTTPSPTVLPPRSGEPTIMPAAGTLPTEPPTTSATAVAPEAPIVHDAPPPDPHSYELPPMYAPEPEPPAEPALTENPEQASSDGGTRPA